MTQKAALLLICYAWKPINDPNITDDKSAVKMYMKCWLLWHKAAKMLKKTLIIRRAKRRTFFFFFCVLLQCYWSILTYLKTRREHPDSDTNHIYLPAHTRTQTHKTKHTFWSLYSSGNINRPLEAFLNIHWRGIKRSLLTTCKTLTPDRQTNENNNKTSQTEDYSIRMQAN